MFPVFLKIANRLALVVGGGPVGQRKAKTILEAGGRVRLVCLEAAQKSLDAPDHLQWLQEEYRPEHLNDVSLAFAAATPAVNRQVAADARRRGIWVNIANDPEGSDFHLPAVLRRGDLLVAVGTGGAAPALAQEIRDLLEAQFDDAFEKWIGALAELRPLILAKVGDPNRRHELFHRLCRWDWLERFRQEDSARVRAAMRAAIVERE